MPKKIVNSTLDASTVDIMNVIRENASFNYQNSVPIVNSYVEVPVVGEVIYGTPALANEFLNSLVNRIATTRIKSATFNNPYRDLKKGYLEFGETIEEIFVGIAKVRLFNNEKVDEYEFKRTLPDVKAAFHAINWKVQYPVTIQDEDLRMAFTAENGVRDLIARIVDQVYTGAEYDEFLLFKYMLIKGVNAGDIYTDDISATAQSDKDYATEFRALSNEMLFMNNKYNAYPVRTTCPRERQRIFMDARYNAKFDVEVLASAFNMDKADFMGRLTLIDNWDTFDNERWADLVSEGNPVSEVTAAELANMQGIKAILIDEEWFQVYDNLARMTEKYAASGLYWNYFYNNWKTVSWSPFANAVVVK